MPRTGWLYLAGFVYTSHSIDFQSGTIGRGDAISKKCLQQASKEKKRSRFYICKYFLAGRPASKLKCIYT